MIDKLFIIISVVILLILKTTMFQPFILLYITAKIVTLIYSCFVGKRMVFANLYNIKVTLYEMKTNVYIGIKLMLANIASLLILGIGRLIIYGVWGVVEFGKISFILSLTNLILQFINQVSMVMFPALRQTNKETLNKLHTIISNILSIILPLFLIIYIPIKFIINIWLPQYSESLEYLSFLLVLCIFEVKMNVLCNTYFKVLRKENALLFINTVTMILSSTLMMASGYLYKSLILIIISMVIAIAFRCIISEIYLARLMRTQIKINYVFELMLVVLYIILTRYLPSPLSVLLFFVVYLFYLASNINKIKDTVFLIKVIELVKC